MENNERLQNALNRLADAMPKSIDLSLHRIKTALNKLGDPHKKLPPVIHIAGTNGKGSTLAFLRSIYRQAGYVVHSYSSPHIISFCERIHLNNHDIEPVKMAAAIDDFLQQKITDLTYFEAITVIAITLFATQKADVLILETGLGGRMDATNVIDTKIATIITPISMDHQDRLGDTIEKIAAEKIAICLKNTPIFCGQQHDSVKQMVINASRELNAPLKMLRRDFTVDIDTMLFKHNDLSITLPQLQLYGDHQIDNAAVVTMCAIELNKILPVNNIDIINGLKNTTWPARLQKISPKILNLPPHYNIYVDGSHNEAGAETLSEFLKQKKSDYCIVIIGCLARKDWQAILKPIIPNANEINLVPVTGHETSWDTDEIADYIGQKYQKNAKKHECWQHAIANISIKNQKTTVIITGSLYLAGNVLKTLQKK